MADKITIDQLAQMTKDQRTQIYQANNIPQQQIEQIESSIASRPVAQQGGAQQGGEPAEECIFCSLINGKIPSKKVAENADFIAVLDIQPKTPGHTVIISKRHTDKYETLADTELASLNMIKKEVLDRLINSLGATGSTIISSGGLSSGQKVPNYAENIIPTYGDAPELPGLDMITPQRSSALVHDIINSKVEAALLNDSPKKKQDSGFNF